MPRQPKTSFGIAGWSYPDWEGVVYPRPKPKGFHPLKYLSNYVDLIEINTTFYHPLSERNASNWCRLLKDKGQFKFTLKLWRKFTHEMAGLSASNVSVFRKGLKPLIEENRISALLMQFPWRFNFTKKNFSFVDSLIDEFGDLKPAVEIRHGSWENDEFFSFLKKKKCAFVNIDEPTHYKFANDEAMVTSDVSYVRLHGRNKSAWFSKTAGRDERYNYLYSKDELKPWVERIKKMSRKSKKCVVVTNNHFRGNAVANALELKSMYSKKKIQVPPKILKSFPHLKEYAAPEKNVLIMNPFPK